MCGNSRILVQLCIETLAVDIREEYGYLTYITQGGKPEG